MHIKHDLHKLVVARQIAAAGLIVSGLIHLALTSEHLPASPILGVVFWGVALLQLLLGNILLLWPTPSLWLGAVILIVFSLTMSVIARVAGLPLGYEHGLEAIELIEVVAKASELIALGGLAMSIVIRQTMMMLQPASRSYRLLFELVGLGIFAALLVIGLGSHVAPQQEDDDHPGAQVPIRIVNAIHDKELVHNVSSNL
jgi:hypothetical protein